jgi:hypothetical protein
MIQSLQNKMKTSNNIKYVINNLINKYNQYENIVISCIFKNFKILSYGISKPDNHMITKQFSKHAEMDAITNYIYKYNKKERNKIGNVNILTIRYKYNDNNLILLTSHSCQFCIKSINKFNLIDKIYFIENNNIYVNQFKNIYNNINLFGYSSGDRRVFKY